MNTSEKSFEAHIETILTTVTSGYRKRDPKNYNTLLLPEGVIYFWRMPAFVSNHLTMTPKTSF